ncbi:adenylate/guanylate cyclase domain-containing protein [Candidatus Phyllobacterium onerii]|uniref:adenylate/guanylate cyclase domain-containing protein n=1 Tax=Candidatus Phyllobacterium onerii TaxID=3020828 RepID=UPI003A866B90
MQISCRFTNEDVKMLRVENHAGRSHCPTPFEMDSRDAKLVFASALFADIKGFTRFCQAVDLPSAFHALSTFHRRMAQVVSGFSATVITNTGDEVMAAWCGTPSAVASKALRCGFAMLESVEAWNREDSSRRPGLNIGVGLHAGPVVLGQIPGLSESRMSVFGDTVNTASRLEQMTRAYSTDLIASDELVRMASAITTAERGSNRLHSAITAKVRDRAGLLSIRISA